MEGEGPDGRAFRRVGSDLLWLSGERLAIETDAEMEHWEVRRYRQTLVRYAQRTWRIARRSAGRSLAVRYVLEPWTPGPLEPTGPVVDYGLGFVLDRDRERAAHRRDTRIATGLWLLLPLVGLLGAGTKKQLQRRFGINPVTATRASLGLEAALLLVTATLLTLSSFTGLAGGGPLLDERMLMFVALGCAVDMLFRYHSVLAEERYPPGLFQWILPRRK